MELNKNRNTKIIIANALVVSCYFLMIVFNLGANLGRNQSSIIWHKWEKPLSKY